MRYGPFLAGLCKGTKPDSIMADAEESLACSCVSEIALALHATSRLSQLAGRCCWRLPCLKVPQDGKRFKKYIRKRPPWQTSIFHLSVWRIRYELCPLYSGFLSHFPVSSHLGSRRHHDLPDPLDSRSIPPRVTND